MNTRQLKYVIVLSQEQSFSRAADVLNISQPSLSQYIKNIEEQLGAPLFVRLNGEVRLTDVGEEYITIGKKILALEKELDNKITDINGFNGGTITVGISPYRSVHIIPKILKEFNKLYPNIKLIISEKSGNDLLDSALHRDFDLCIIALPVDKKIFNYEIIKREELVVAVNKSTKLYNKLLNVSEVCNGREFPAIDISLIDGEDFAVLNELMPMRIAADNVLYKYGVSINEKIELTSNETLLSVVGSGVCASLIPSGLVDDSTDTVGLFSIKQDFDFRDVAVIWHKEQFISEPIQDLINIFKSYS